MEENADNISTILTHFHNYSNETYDADDLSYIFEKIYSEVSFMLFLLLWF